MEFTAESSLLKAQHLLVQYLCQKSYYNDNNNINYKLYNAQFLLNDYVSNQHKLMFDNYKYMEKRKEINENNEVEISKDEEYDNDEQNDKESNYKTLIF